MLMIIIVINFHFGTKIVYVEVAKITSNLNTARMISDLHVHVYVYMYVLPSYLNM